MLVTGAAGRIGKHLVNALVKQGEKVRVLIKDDTIENENVEVFYGDLLNKESLKKAVDGVDVIYHLAAVVDYLAPKDLMFNVNVIGTKNLLEVSKAKKFIYLSSTAVMGKKLKEIPANENTACKPSNFYGKTKLDAEKLVKEAGGIIIRSVDVFGPGFTEGYEYVISGLENGSLPIIGNGKNFIHWIHINDLIQALILAKEKGKHGEVYIVAGKEVKTLRECFNLLCKYLDVEPPKKQVSKFLAKALANFKVLKAKIKKQKPKIIPEYIEKITANRSFDISKARKELGFEPKVSYEDAAREMVEEYKLKKQKENITKQQSKD
ncbi:MAG: GDP-mannose 4,6-dehydratase [Candidatus Aenigmatarchaeota archaeon]